MLFDSYLSFKKENTHLLDYCYSLEKILSRNSLRKNKKFSTKYNSLVKDITLFGANKTKGALVNKIIDQYKNSKKLYFINFENISKKSDENT